MTERFTVSVSDETYDRMEENREKLGLSRSAYTEAALRNDMDQTTSLDHAIAGLETGIAITFVLMVLSGGWILWALFFASSAASENFLPAIGLFAASTIMTLGLPYVVTRIDSRNRARRRKAAQEMVEA